MVRVFTKSYYVCAFILCFHIQLWSQIGVQDSSQAFEAQTLLKALDDLLFPVVIDTVLLVDYLDPSLEKYEKHRLWSNQRIDSSIYIRLPQPDPSEIKLLIQGLMQNEYAYLRDSVFQIYKRHAMFFEQEWATTYQMNDYVCPEISERLGILSGFEELIALYDIALAEMDASEVYNMFREDTRHFKSGQSRDAVNARILHFRPLLSIYANCTSVPRHRAIGYNRYKEYEDQWYYFLKQEMMNCRWLQESWSLECDLAYSYLLDYMSEYDSDLEEFLVSNLDIIMNSRYRGFLGEYAVRFGSDNFFEHFAMSITTEYDFQQSRYRPFAGIARHLEGQRQISWYEAVGRALAESGLSIEEAFFERDTEFTDYLMRKYPELPKFKSSPDKE